MIAGILVVVLFVAFAVAGDLLSEEVRGWLDLVPQGLLRLAAARLPKSQRETVYQGEWVPELEYALKGKGARPVTRLIVGIWYAAGMILAAGEVARRVERAPESPGTFAHAGVAAAEGVAPQPSIVTMRNPVLGGTGTVKTGGGAATLVGTGTLEVRGGKITGAEANQYVRRTIEQMEAQTRARIGTRIFEPPWERR